MIARLAVLLLLLAAPAAAQPRGFSCVGADDLEDDVVAVPFVRGNASLREAARAAIATAVAAAKAEPRRNLCVFGHADRRAGAETSTQLAVQRARAVSGALAQGGIPRDRIRAEARVGAYSGRVTEPAARAVTIVLLPARGN